MIAKTLLSTLVRKKARTLLLLFSIAACSSLLFANAGFQKTCAQMIYDSGTRQIGNAELYITVKQSVGAEEWIDPETIAPYSEVFEYAHNVIQTKALYATSDIDIHYFTAFGTDIHDFNTRNPLTLQSGNTDDWTGDKLIIGKVFADKLGIIAGDMLPLEINGITREFLIAGVSQPKGLFLREAADGGYILMPRETLENLLGGSCNLIYIKTNDPSSVTAVMQTLTEAFPQYNVMLGINHDVIRAETNNYTMPFWFSSICVIFMSVFIIYSSFNLIVNERIRILGILRSVGCARRKINRILIFESMIIGVMGGAFGCVFGIGILHMIKNIYFSGEAAVVDAPVIFGAYEILFTLTAAIIITILSAMLPIINVTKMPVKNIILNDYQKQKIKTDKLWVLGIFLLLPVCIVPSFIGKGMMGMIIASIAVTSALVGLNLIIPAVCRIAARIIGKAPHEIVLGVRNAGDLKALVNNIRLFATTMAIMAFMTTIFNTLGTDLRDSFQRENYDVFMELRESNSKTIKDLSCIDGVSDCYGFYLTWGSLPDYGTFLNGLIGIDGMNHFDYFPADISSEAAVTLSNLKDNEMVTSYIFRDKLGLKLGDIITVQLAEGVFTYVITGFIDTNWGIGHVGYISSDTYKADIGTEYFSHIAVKAKDSPDAVKNNILRAFSKNVLSIQTKREMKEANADKVIGIFNAIKIYAYFAMFIGLLGIINNMIACFLGRRRNLALYRCIGMSGKSVGRMLTTEAVTIGIIGVLTGVTTGILTMGAIPFLVGMLWGNVTVAVPVVDITVMCVLGIAAMLICSLIPLIKGRNISIMDNIRYE